MEGRERVRRCLGARDTDRPPLIAFATDLAARLEQVDPSALWQDAGVLTRTLMGLEGLFGLDAIVVDVPVAALADGRLATVADGLARLRTLLDERAALVLALPGPFTCAAAAGRDRAPETIEDLGAEILDAAKVLGPEHADCLAVVERAPVTGDDAQRLDDALAPLWNAARYYAAPSLLVVAEGTAELADSGADALVVWAGASPYELVARGARRVGAPIEPPTAPTAATELPELPAGGFYTTRGELAADTEIEWLHRVVAATGEGR
jgi:hypothetical protein